MSCALATGCAGGVGSRTEADRPSPGTAEEFRLVVAVEPVAATVRVSEEEGSGPGGFEPVSRPARPGAEAVFVLPRNRQFLVMVEASGYFPHSFPLGCPSEGAEARCEVRLVVGSATSLDLVPPPFKGHPLGRVMVDLRPESARGDGIKVEAKADGGPEFPGGFPGGKCRAVATRGGFRQVDLGEFTVPTGQPFVLEIPAMEEVFGYLVVEDAPVGAEVVVLDGEESLLASPATIPESRSSGPLRVRATNVIVRVSKAGYRTFEGTSRLVPGETARISLSSR